MVDQTKEIQLFPEGGADRAVDGKPDASKSDQTAEALATLVGEGRKYKTSEELAKSYLKADEHIETLKSDNEKLRQEAVKGKTLTDVFERIEQHRKQAGDTTPVAQKGATAEDIARLVDERITGRETAKTREENIRKAQEGLVVKYGDKAKEVYLERGDSPEKRKALNDLAAVDPSSFEALFSTKPIVGNPADGSTKGGDRLVAAASGRVGDAECKEFYDAMRKKDPRSYYSQTTQLEMHKRLNANPTKFLGRKVA